MLTFDFNSVWHLLLGMWWPLVRILALMMTAPIYSSRNIPVRYKVLAGIVITAVVAPGLPPAPEGDFLMLLLQQILVGAVLGFSVQLVFAAVEMAGDFIGLQIGLGFATLVDPVNSHQTPVTGSFFSILAMLVFLSMNGHLMLIAQVADSFTVIPISSDVTAGFNFLTLTHWGSEVFRLGFMLAMPVVTTILICNIALGVLARIAPQLSIFSVGFALTLSVGMLMLMVSLPYLAAPLERALSSPLWLQAR
jgi:flagellar biosynthetic protein FliR